MIFLPGNHTVAVVKGKESHEIIQTSCARIFSDVNRIVESGFVSIGEKHVPVEMFLGGDYKVNSNCNIFNHYLLIQILHL